MYCKCEIFYASMYDSKVLVLVLSFTCGVLCAPPDNFLIWLLTDNMMLLQLIRCSILKTNVVAVHPFLSPILVHDFLAY